MRDAAQRGLAPLLLLQAKATYPQDICTSVKGARV
jgi:hypothetical protein